MPSMTRVSDRKSFKPSMVDLSVDLSRQWVLQ